MCTCHGVDSVEKGGRTKRRYCKPVVAVVAFNTQSRLRPVHPGLETYRYDPSLCPETGLAQLDPQQPRTGATNSPRVLHHRAVYTPSLPPFKTLLAHPWGLGSLRGRAARGQREARWVQHGQLV
jgi:hypothetical protein